MKFGMMGALGVAGLSDFGEFWHTFLGAQMFNHRYLRHFLSDRHKILHG